MKERINRFALRILEFHINQRNNKGKSPFSSDCEKKLSLLSPGQNAKKLVAEYYKKKVANIIMAVAAILIIILLTAISRMTSPSITDGHTLKRNTTGSGNYNISLSVKADDEDLGTLNLLVEEQRLTDKECNKAMEELYEKLLFLLPADNNDLSHIDSDLFFPTEVEGYPFSLRWESGDYMLVDSMGHINNDGISEEGVPLDITVVMTYEDIQKPYDFKVVIYPKVMEGKDLIKKHIKEVAAEENENSINDVYFNLPLYVDNKELAWKEEREPVIPILSVISVCLLIGIWLGTDKDLNKKYEERDRQMIVEYAEFVSKLQILLSSGKTIRKAFEHIYEEYKNARAKGGEKKYVYEELGLCIKHLGDGMKEEDCYEYFGKRCNLLCYKKLMSILIQNLRKGTDGLLEAMDDEVHAAFEERKAFARRLGEEAQTKLIFPMMLMLGVVMIIIMIPAYLSFGVM